MSRKIQLSDRQVDILHRYLLGEEMDNATVATIEEMIGSLEVIKTSRPDPDYLHILGID